MYLHMKTKKLKISNNSNSNYFYHQEISEIEMKKKKFAMGKEVLWLEENGNKISGKAPHSYLGLETHPEVMKAAEKAFKEYGFCSPGHPREIEAAPVYRELEKELARFMKQDDVILCGSGNQTKLQGISLLCDPGEIILLDEKSHKTLFHGAVLSKAAHLTYKHKDMDHLEKQLAKNKDKQITIIADSVFAANGSLSSLNDIAALAQKYGSRLIVDETHGIGLLGKNGRGGCELYGIEKQADLIISSFSKTFGYTGGFLTGKKELLDKIKAAKSRLLFSAGFPPKTAGALKMAISLIKENPNLRQKILEKAQFLGEQLKEMGYTTEYHETPIIPVSMGDKAFTLEAHHYYLKKSRNPNPGILMNLQENKDGFSPEYYMIRRWKDLRSVLDVFAQYKKEYGKREV